MSEYRLPKPFFFEYRKGNKIYGKQKTAENKHIIKKN